MVYYNLFLINTLLDFSILTTKLYTHLRTNLWHIDTCLVTNSVLALHRVMFSRPSCPDVVSRVLFLYVTFTSAVLPTLPEFPGVSRIFQLIFLELPSPGTLPNFIVASVTQTP